MEFFTIMCCQCTCTARMYCWETPICLSATTCCTPILVWFDINDPVKPVFKGRKEDVFPQTLPPTEDGLSQYDYSDVEDVKLLSKLSVGK